MKRLLFIFASASLALAANAQETYENANLATKDLNGTARYVGMGGAIDALGADLSTIGTNPAGIGLFRHSTANVSFGVMSQQGAKDFDNSSKTHMSFDQAGFVYSRRMSQSSFLNVAFSYNKGRDFNQILSAAAALQGASQNKLSYIKGTPDDKGNGLVYNLALNDQKKWVGLGNYGGQTDVSSAFTQVDYLYYNTMLPIQPGSSTFKYANATGFDFNRASRGYIGEYNFNVSGNINDRFYLGMTFGISDVHYKSYSEYNESLEAKEATSLADERRITGTGFNVKAGVIFRPVETSPFRIGVSVATPTWYDLTTSNSTSLVYYKSLGGNNPSESIGESYDFKLYTPWTFGLSLGTTVGDYLALGAVYEYSDYGSLDSRIKTGSGYDDWGYYYDESESDHAMNDHTNATLKGVHTLKLGAEIKPDANFAIRLGYNYVSPMYSKDGFKDGTLDSPGSYYSSSTDFTNWGATNRLTCGFGYNIKNFSVDLAYQYSVQKGDFYPFMNYFDADPNSELNNVSQATKVDNKRHQVLLTLGYHF